MARTAQYETNGHSRKVPMKADSVVMQIQDKLETPLREADFADKVR